MDQASVATQLKVCGVTRREDLIACVELGVDAVGLNFWPQSKRALTLEQAKVLVDDVELGDTKLVGVFVEASAAEVGRVAEVLRLHAVQLHGDMEAGGYTRVAALAGAGWVRVVRGTMPLDELVALDAGRDDDAEGGGSERTAPPSWTILDAQVEGFGGAGKATDWAWAAQAVHALAPAQVWLAGGLGPDNAAAAIAQVRPFGLDVASGVERAGATHGEKDPEKIAALLRICKNAGES